MTKTKRSLELVMGGGRRSTFFTPELFPTPNISHRLNHVYSQGPDKVLGSTPGPQNPYSTDPSFYRPTSEGTLHRGKKVRGTSKSLTGPNSICYNRLCDATDPSGSRVSRIRR